MQHTHALVNIATLHRHTHDMNCLYLLICKSLFTTHTFARERARVFILPRAVPTDQYVAYRHS